MLTISTLHDLVKARKLKKQANQTGPQGGRFYRTSGGKKVYVETPGVKTIPVSEIASAAGKKVTQKQVPVRIIPTKGKGPSQDTRMGQKVGGKEPIASKKTPAQEKLNWRRYSCKVCGAHVVPHREEKRVPLQYPHENDVQHYHRILFNTALRDDEKPTNLPMETTIKERVVMVPTHGPHKGEAISLDPGDVQPEMVENQICPHCAKEHVEPIRKPAPRKVQSFRIKATPQSRAAGKARRKEAKRTQKLMVSAQKKTPGNRTEGEKKVLATHEAQAAVHLRAMEERAKEEERSKDRPRREKVWMENQETKALEQVRHLYRQHLIKMKGMDPHEASKKAAEADAKTLRNYQLDESHRKMKQAEEVRQKMGSEIKGSGIAQHFSHADLAEHYGARREAPDHPDSQRHAALAETLMSPAERSRIAEARRKDIKERKKKKPKLVVAKKIKKSVWLAI